MPGSLHKHPEDGWRKTAGGGLGSTGHPSAGSCGCSPSWHGRPPAGGPRTVSRADDWSMWSTNSWAPTTNTAITKAAKMMIMTRHKMIIAITMTRMDRKVERAGLDMGSPVLWCAVSWLLTPPRDEARLGAEVGAHVAWQSQANLTSDVCPLVQVVRQLMRVQSGPTTSVQRTHRPPSPVRHKTGQTAVSGSGAQAGDPRAERSAKTSGPERR